MRIAKFIQKRHDVTKMVELTFLQHYPYNGYGEQTAKTILIVLATNRWVVQYRPLKGLSCVMGNYHAQFLGGEGP